MQWTPMPDMKTPRWGHACTLFKDEFTSYVLVAGGWNLGALASTEMYFLNGTVQEGKPMKKKRSHFHMIFMDQPIPRIHAIGGKDGREHHDSIEMWGNSKTWKMTSIKMKTPRSSFGAVALPKSIMPEIDCQE